jgi:S1-C subfamily serine protease
MISKRTIFEIAAALGGIPVLGALASSPAARAGIRYGDVVLSVNGRRTRTMVDYVDGKALRLDGMDVVIFRGGEELSIQLVYQRSSEATPDTAAILAELIGMRIVEGDEPSSNGGDAD